jgi:short-subunit dehydrogenase
MKTVLVTGASSGMGKDAAARLATEGYTVYGAARNVEKMRDLEATGVVALKMDITKEDDVVAVVERIAAETGGVDVLVNNAGFGLYGAAEDTSMEDARYQFDVNVFGLARLTQLVLPHMRERNAGTIINISSMGGRIYTPMGAWYHATKHAIEGWSDCLRLELKQFNVDVVVVEPGMIDTNFYEPVMKSIMKSSGEGPYSAMVKRMADGMRSAAESDRNVGSPPSVISEVICKALKARRPKTRYVAGRMARMLLFIRRWFGDRFYDRMIMSQLA